MTSPIIAGIAPFFILRDAPAALAFYRDQLGFEVSFQQPADAPFFAIVRRGNAMIMLKAVDHENRDGSYFTVIIK